MTRTQGNQNHETLGHWHLRIIREWAASHAGKMRARHQDYV